jgi:phage gpG-like protein
MLSSHNPAREALKRLKATKRTLPRIVGNQAKNFFLDSFRRGGFTDGSFKAWQEPKRRQLDEGGKSYRYKGYQKRGSGKRGSKTGHSKSDRTRAILVQSGAMRDSVQVKRMSESEVVIGANTKYAARHNYGLHKMPKRQFIGNSATLRKELKTTIKKHIKKALFG